VRGAGRTEHVGAEVGHALVVERERRSVRGERVRAGPVLPRLLEADAVVVLAVLALGVHPLLELGLVRRELVHFISLRLRPHFLNPCGGLERGGRERVGERGERGVVVDRGRLALPIVLLLS
jgi:hypothetical protein